MASEIRADGELIFGIDIDTTKTNFITGIKQVLEEVEKSDATKISLFGDLSALTRQLDELKLTMSSMSLGVTSDSLKKLQEDLQRTTKSGIEQGIKNANSSSSGSASSSNRSSGGSSGSDKQQNSLTKYAKQVQNLFNTYEKTSAANEAKIRKLWMPVDREELQLYSSVLSEYYQQYKENGKDIANFSEDELQYILEINKTFASQLEVHKNTTSKLSEQTGLSWSKLSTEIGNQIVSIEKYSQKFPDSANKLEAYIDFLKELQVLNAERGVETPESIKDILTFINNDFNAIKESDAIAATEKIEAERLALEHEKEKAKAAVEEARALEEEAKRLAAQDQFNNQWIERQRSIRYVNSAIDEYLSEFPQQTEKVQYLKDALSELYNVTMSREGDIKEVGEYTEVIFKEFQQIKAAPIEKAANAFTRLGDNAKAALSGISDFLKRSLYFTVIQSVVSFIGQQVRLTLDYVVEIDDALTQIAIVTERNVDDLTDFANEAASIAAQVGSSITDIISSTEVWSRLGLETN